MKIKFILFIAAFLIQVQTSFAAPIISGISTHEINIDTNFTGAEVLLFGAKGDAGNVVVTVRGPKKNYILNKKDKFLGIWYNKDRLKFSDAYSYYTFFSSNKDTIIDSKLLSELEIGQDKIKFDIDEENIDDQFKVEFVNKLEKKNLYLNKPGGIDFLDETLFKVILKFPKNVVQGVYVVDIYLIDDDQIVAFQAIPIYVNQVGFSAEVNRFAYENSISYGLLAVLIAVLAGFLVNYIFNKYFFHR